MAETNEKEQQSAEHDAPPHRHSRRLDLRPGHEIQIQAVNSKAKIVTRYVGQCEASYLIVRNGARSDDSIERMRFMQDEMALARFVLDGVAFGFRSPVLSVHRVPETLLYLKWPDEVAEHAIRSAMRVPCFAAARVEVDREILQAALTDISATGCRVDLLGVEASAITEGKELLIWAYLPGQSEPAEIRCVVRRRQTPDDCRLVLGLSFDTPQHALVDKLRAYLPEID